MNGTYILCLLLSGLFFSPMPCTDDVLVAQFSIYMTGDREHMRWESVVDQNIFRHDCEALHALILSGKEICSESEVEFMRRVYEQMEIKPDTLTRIKEKF